MNNLLVSIVLQPHMYIFYNNEGAYVDLDKYLANIKTDSEEEKFIDPAIHQITQKDEIPCTYKGIWFLNIWNEEEQRYVTLRNFIQNDKPN